MSGLKGMMRRSLALAMVMILLVGAMGMDAFADSDILQPPAPPGDVQDGEPDAGPGETDQPEIPEVTDIPEPTAEPSPEPIPTPEQEPPVTPQPPVVTPEPPPAQEEPVLPSEMPQEGTEEQTEGSISDDPLYWELFYTPRTIANIPNSFDAVTPRALKEGETLRKGIDVSEFQGNINWNAVRAAGIEFAIIRVAYRGAQYGTLGKDADYVQNLKNAKAAGLRVGAYFLSQAITTEEAREEARFLVSIVKNYSIDLPLVFDYEEVPAVKSRRLVMSKLSRQLKTDIANAFCDEVEKNGYEGMVYTNLSMLGTDLYPSQLGRVWLAHWTEKSGYAGDYEYWQFGAGTVSGISNEVDLDFWFEPKTPVTPPSGGSVVPASPSPSPIPSPTPSASPSPSPTPPAEAGEFTDVKPTDWYYEDVKWAAQNNIVSGVGDGVFDPKGTATRAHVVTMLYRMEGQPEVRASAGFTDLTADYYKAAVNWAATTGIVKGTSATTFSPNKPITRQDLVTLLYRMAGAPTVSGSLSGFVDSGSVQSYAKTAMIWAIQKGLVKGYSDNYIRPVTSATRAEVCALLRRYNDLT